MEREGQIRFYNGGKWTGDQRHILKKNGHLRDSPIVGVARVKKNFFVVQILGGEKLLKFVEKCR